MSRNIKIMLEYDGSNYSGWQIQSNTSNTIQGILEEKLSKINKKKLKVIGAGRTDAGVHALGQVANFLIDVSIPVQKIPEVLNKLLPDDIVCKSAEEKDINFHARYEANEKKYRYRILNQELPSVFIRNYIYHVPHPLDLEKMQEAANILKGTHDFLSFQASGSQNLNTIRIIKDLKVFRHKSEIWLEISGNGFLYKMVRNITGTLIEVGLGKRTPCSIEKILKNKNRSEAGFTAPASGLTLLEVYY